MTSFNRNIFRVTGHLCGEFTGPGEFPTQRPVTRSFDVFFDLRLNKRLSKQWWGWWFDTLSRPLWRHRNEVVPCNNHQVWWIIHFLYRMAGKRTLFANSGAEHWHPPGSGIFQHLVQWYHRLGEYFSRIYILHHHCLWTVWNDHMFNTCKLELKRLIKLNACGDNTCSQVLKCWFMMFLEAVSKFSLIS